MPSGKGYVRDYQTEYKHESPKRKKARAKRNTARAKLKKAGVVKKGDGKQVHHKDGNTNNNGRSNLTAKSVKSHPQPKRKGQKAKYNPNKYKKRVVKKARRR